MPGNDDAGAARMRWKRSVSPHSSHHILRQADMRTPSDIVIEQRLDKNTRTTKFFVSEPVKVHDIYGFIVELRERFSFPTFGDLIAFLDMSDYRYVCGSRGKWRLP